MRDLTELPVAASIVELLITTYEGTEGSPGKARSLAVMVDQLLGHKGCEPRNNTLFFR